MIQAKSDLFFRYLLGREEDEDLRVDFINSVLADAGQPLITSAKVLNPFNPRATKTDKESILDIKCQTLSGDFVTIEMQILGSDDYTKRALYYWARTYASQLGNGQIYGTLKPVISIHILDFNLYQKEDDDKKAEILNDNKMHHCFGIFERENKDLELIKDFQIHFIEMPKFKAQIQNKEELKGWIDFFSNIKEDQVMLLAEQPSTMINKAILRFQEFTADNDLRYQYEAEERYLRDTNSRLHEAEQTGLTRGRAEGRAEGSRAKAIETARSMIEDNFPDSTIAKHTGLSLAEIQNLK